MDSAAILGSSAPYVLLAVDVQLFTAKETISSKMKALVFAVV